MTEEVKSAANRAAKKREQEPAEKPVSLAPLSFEDAVKLLAGTKSAKGKQ